MDMFNTTAATLIILSIIGFAYIVYDGETSRGEDTELINSSNCYDLKHTIAIKDFKFPTSLEQAEHRYKWDCEKQ